MGILNVTPDSLSDGGQYFDRDRAIARGKEMEQEGEEISMLALPSLCQHVCRTRASMIGPAHRKCGA